MSGKDDERGGRDAKIFQKIGQNKNREKLDKKLKENGYHFVLFFFLLFVFCINLTTHIQGQRKWGPEI